MFFLLSIITLLSHVGGSPKSYLVGTEDDHKYLVRTKDDHEQPMMPGNEAEDEEYYYSDEVNDSYYEDETSKILLLLLRLLSNCSAWDYKLIPKIGLNHPPTIQTSTMIFFKSSIHRLSM